MNWLPEAGQSFIYSPSLWVCSFKHRERQTSGILWSHLSCPVYVFPSKIISTTFFSTIDYGVSVDSTIRDWTLLGAFMTLFFITDLCSQWFDINLWPSGDNFTVLLPPLSDRHEEILRGESGPFSLLFSEFLQHHQSLPLTTGDWMLQWIRSGQFKEKRHLR